MTTPFKRYIPPEDKLCSICKRRMKHGRFRTFNGGKNHRWECIHCWPEEQLSENAQRAVA